jgi:hypothetical protein
VDKKSEPGIGLDRPGEPNIDPAPDKPPEPPEPEDSRAWKAVKKGAKWGSVAGFVTAQFYMSNYSPHGFYVGNVMLVFVYCIGLGSALGAGIGWLITQTDDEVPLPPAD